MPVAITEWLAAKAQLMVAQCACCPLRATKSSAERMHTYQLIKSPFARQVYRCQYAMLNRALKANSTEILTLECCYRAVCACVPFSPN